MITERAADLYDSVGSAAGNDQYVFVHWVTLEGENPGLVQPGMRARIGVAKEDGQPLDEYNTRWLRYYAEVEGYAEEERVAALSLRGSMCDMQEKKDPLISLPVRRAGNYPGEGKRSRTSRQQFTAKSPKRYQDAL